MHSEVDGRPLCTGDPASKLVTRSPDLVELLHRNVKRLRGRLVFKAHRLVYHSTLDVRVIKKKKETFPRMSASNASFSGTSF